jgi:hypothetical protein
LALKNKKTNDFFVLRLGIVLIACFFVLPHVMSLFLNRESSLVSLLEFVYELSALVLLSTAAGSLFLSIVSAHALRDSNSRSYSAWGVFQVLFRVLLLLAVLVLGTLLSAILFFEFNASDFLVTWFGQISLVVGAVAVASHVFLVLWLRSRSTPEEE